jgi:uncharacterized membrane protein
MRCLTVFAAVAISLFASAEAKADLSVCNDFNARIHVAFAFQNQRDIPASGWWSVEPGVCQTVDFQFKGATLYYAADSDNYKDGAKTSHDHWGNKIKLFVRDGKFDFDDAQTRHHDTTGEMFSSYVIPPNFLGKFTKLEFHFLSGKTNITITGPK